MRINRWSISEAEAVRKNFLEMVDSRGEEAAIVSIRELCSDPRNIALFAHFFLPHYFNREFKDVHYRTLEKAHIGVNNFHVPIFLHYSEGYQEDFLVGIAHMAYRGHGKTSVVLVLKTIYETCYNFNPYVVINSYSTAMAIDKIKLIKDEFESNDKLRMIFGEPVGAADYWNKSDLTVFGHTRIRAISTGQNPRGLIDKGTRPTRILSDDILDDSDVLSSDLRQKAMDWYKKALMNALASGGYMEIINTPLHEEDIIMQIMKGNPPFHNWITNQIDGMENGISVDPDWKTTEQLLEMMKDEYTFAQEIMNAPKKVESGIVKHEDLRFWEVLPQLQGPIYIHHDLTHTAKQTSDFYCMGGMTRTIDGMFILLDFILLKGDDAEQSKQVIGFYQKMQGYGITIEKITYDAIGHDSFGYWAKKLAREEHDLSLPLEPIKYPKDKVSHFSPHLPHIKANRVLFPKHHAQINQALDQLLAFPHAKVHDDFVDMLSGVMDFVCILEDSQEEDRETFYI